MVLRKWHYCPNNANRSMSAWASFGGVNVAILTIYQKSMKEGRLRHIHCLRGRHTYEHHPPTMLARYNLRGQEASDYSGAFFFGYQHLANPSKRNPMTSLVSLLVFGGMGAFGT